MSDRQPLQRPLRVKSRYKWLEGKEFPVDYQGTKKLLRDCTEQERQFIVDSGSDNTSSPVSSHGIISPMRLPGNGYRSTAPTMTTCPRRASVSMWRTAMATTSSNRQRGTGHPGRLVRVPSVYPAAPR